MAVEGVYWRKADRMPHFDFSEEKFMFKRTWQVVFGAPEIISGTPNNLPTRLKARDGLHSEVVAPEDGKSGTKT